MKPNEIKAALILKNIKHKDVARALAVSEASVSLVVSGISRSHRIQSYIAQLLNRPMDEIWPKVAV